MNLDDTIVAIATPPGRGGIGVVRLSGPEARAIAEPLLRLKHPLQPGRAIFGDLIDLCGAGAPAREAGGANHSPTLNSAEAAEARLRSAGRPGAAVPTSTVMPERVDEVVVTYFQKPHSYTTDDVIEISAHGSPVVLRHIVELAMARGARLAEPGEFTMRAFLNGRLDLTQAEAVRDLIDAQTLFQAKVAARQLEGALSNRLKPIKKGLVHLIALLEAGIDFAEDDVSVAPDGVILECIADIAEPLDELSSSFTYGKVVHEGLTLAIVGRPNVGKSSLFNRLVERDRAIVTAQPGTTRDLVTETVAIGGIPVNLVDTAGIRRALDEAESIGIKKSMEALADADLVLVVIDTSQPQSGEDLELLTSIEGRAVIVVENKSDLIGAGNVQAGADILLPASECRSAVRVSTSALTGEGIPALRKAILNHVGGERAAAQEPGFLTSVRHQKLVDAARTALEAATRAVGARVPHEMLLLDLYGALRPLDEITGATTTDDILNLIFGSFCIGK